MVDMQDPFDLDRFVTAQAPVLAAVREELRAGRKRTHWMWFVFPQLRALGRSTTAVHYGIASLAEAQAYLTHPLLGPRLLECTGLVCTHRDRSLQAILGSPDDMKFRSCMTLFAKADPAAIFPEALAIFCGSEPDPLTTELLAAG
ncbi:DUF1810 domain-containing protein [Roseomonas terrae]|uniref:DUF1810 domain-containing protein n=2 Tax=Neoroseomonas terrae TaxID=424799 RepID=A0ABS5EJ00_9PROT|nr:DUF1810 domain-containing protein [Neoroseomonas terrae]